MTEPVRIIMGDQKLYFQVEIVQGFKLGSVRMIHLVVMLMGKILGEIVRKTKDLIVMLKQELILKILMLHSS